MISLIRKDERGLKKADIIFLFEEKELIRVSKTQEGIPPVPRSGD